MGKIINRVFFAFCLVVCAPSYSESYSAERNAMLEVLPSVPGWCSKEKAGEFFDLVIKTKPSFCVEVGVFGGSSLFPVASALKALNKGTVIAIDPWDRLESIKHFHPVEEVEHIAWWGKIDFTQIYQDYSKMLSMHKLNDYCITMRTTSEKAAQVIVSYIDILHLDGNHTEKMSAEDVRLYLPKVRPGGYIWLNDTLWNAIQPAVDLLLESCEVVKLIDKGNCILFRKKMI